MELAPNLAEAHLALGYAQFAGRLDVKGARTSYDRAFQLGRGNADIILLYALYCSRAGRADEAHAAIQRALALDPINARVHRAAGSIDYAARRYEEALPRCGARSSSIPGSATPMRSWASALCKWAD